MLVELCVFGGSRGAPHLQNFVMNILINNSQNMKTVPTTHLHFTYDNTADGSLLQKILVDWCVHPGELSGSHYSDSQRWRLYPKGFLFDLALAQHQLTVSGKPRIANLIPRRSDYLPYTLAAPTDSEVHNQKNEFGPGKDIVNRLLLNKPVDANVRR